jgi:hypothetical protein
MEKGLHCSVQDIEEIGKQEKKITWYIEQTGQDYIVQYTGQKGHIVQFM